MALYLVVSRRWLTGDAVAHQYPRRNRFETGSGSVTAAERWKEGLLKHLCLPNWDISIYTLFHIDNDSSDHFVVLVEQLEPVVDLL